MSAPPEIASLNVAGRPPVWKSDLEEQDRGIEVLGSPIGHRTYVNRYCDEKLSHEENLLSKIRTIPDMQCAWLLLVYCAAPRSNHILRTLPPNYSEYYAQRHDRMIRRCLADLMHVQSDLFDHAEVCTQIQLSMRHGGMGFSDSVSNSKGAYWASWIDSLPALYDRFERDLSDFRRTVENVFANGIESLDILRDCQRTLQNEGLQTPSWNEILFDNRQPDDLDIEDNPIEPDERKGWQRVACET